jgi:Rrf2 family protein
MLSQTAEYALRVIVYLAAQAERPSTTREIAGATHVPEGYLAKVLQGLGHIGLVHSQRGLHGGFVLGKPAANLTLYDVVTSVDPIPRVKACPLALHTHTPENLCSLHRRLDDAFAHVEKVFREATIADLLADSKCAKPLRESECDGKGGCCSGQTAGAAAQAPVV